MQKTVSTILFLSLKCFGDKQDSWLDDFRDVGEESHINVHKLRTDGMTWVNHAGLAVSSLVASSKGLSTCTKVSISACTRFEENPSI